MVKTDMEPVRIWREPPRWRSMVLACWREKTCQRLSQFFLGLTSPGSGCPRNSLSRLGLGSRPLGCGS
ncbi:hypothetical protein CRG98_019135 [Punica granatum]|uniref:Uncharacterized protein n=1 Tax=Punica granatum TaxID=22663 RepID=A0A2I0JW12_PUNGR|nr:hypothetical protein CRG98_019135 [Punica granatum]